MSKPYLFLRAKTSRLAAGSGNSSVETLAHFHGHKRAFLCDPFDVGFVELPRFLSKKSNVHLDIMSSQKIETLSIHSRVWVNHASENALYTRLNYLEDARWSATVVTAWLKVHEKHASPRQLPCLIYCHNLSVRSSEVAMASGADCLAIEYDDRVEFVPVRSISSMRGFLAGIDTTVCPVSGFRWLTDGPLTGPLPNVVRLLVLSL